MIKEIGSLIRKQRKSLGYSIEQLAEYSGTSFSTISRIELGKLNDIHLSTFTRILKALNLEFNINNAKNKTTPETRKLLKHLKNLPQEKQTEISSLLLKLINLK